MAKQLSHRQSHDRRLRIEALEGRHLLAVLIVQNDLDETLANLAGDGELSLREAIEIANNPGTDIDGFVSIDVEDTIEFATPFFDTARTIALSSGELGITETLSINGSGQKRLTIDAQEDSRIFNFFALGDFAIADLKLQGGRTTGVREVGGAIRFIGDGTLTIERSRISGNTTTGARARGGGLYSSRPIILRETTIDGNTTEGRLSEGGGAFAFGSVNLDQSIVSGNHTFGDNSSGGGIQVRGDVVLVQSTVRDNQTSGELAFGGGISAYSSVSSFSSTISGNRTLGENSAGGAIASAEASLTQSTVSGNSTSGKYASGGGVFTTWGATISQTTITNNHARHAMASGGGIYNFDQALEIRSSIIAGNTAGWRFPDINPYASTPTVNNSLIGDTASTGIDENTGSSNWLDVDPLLGPLANNGGPTLTHALLPGSPAIDAGDPAIQSNTDEFDQRDAPFLRVADGNFLTDIRVDIGAYEAQTIPTADFDADFDVDGSDFLAWQRGFGMASAVLADGDSDGDTDVDASDLAAWLVSYGPPVVELAVASGQLSVAEERVPASIDFSLLLPQTDFGSDEELAVLADEMNFEAIAALTDHYSLASLANSSREAGTTATDEPTRADLAWLSDELLERVFG